MARETVALVVVVAGAILAGLIVTLYGERVVPAPSSEDVAEQVASVCEAELKKRLLSPSSYRRTEIAAFESAPATFDEYRGRFDPDRIAADLAEIEADPRLSNLETDLRGIFERENPVIVRVWLRYESANAFGAMIQGVSTCVRVMAPGDDAGAPASVADPLYVDGETTLDWALSRS